MLIPFKEFPFTFFSIILFDKILMSVNLEDLI